MKIELHEIPVKDVVKGYIDSDEAGVVGYDGRLNIRPAFQREFIYRDKQRDEVINTITKGFPLNVMYWVKSDDGNYELLDGQQRTISICQYVNGDFSLNHRAFHNLTSTEQEQILNYPLMIYICDGTDKEKLDWFKIINIAGVQLTAQELRNAIYTGEWLADAKKYFSKTSGPAYQEANAYVDAIPNRQGYLEKALKWIADRDGLDEIEDYMATHQHDKNCNEIKLYFKSVIDWAKAIFPKKRKELKKVEWGLFYNKYHNGNYDSSNCDSTELEERVKALLMDDDVTKKSGVYEYLLSGDERYLNIRAFTPAMATAAYERQNGICVKCGKHFEIEGMQADHITPWSEGGKTIAENCQMLCADCNRRKSNT